LLQLNEEAKAVGASIDLNLSLSVSSEIRDTAEQGVRRDTPAMKRKAGSPSPKTIRPTRKV
jgi:hypothetical protein